MDDKLNQKPCEKCATHHTATEDCPADYSKEEFEFRAKYRTWNRRQKREYNKQWKKSKPTVNFCVDCKKEVSGVEFRMFGGKCTDCSIEVS